MVGMFGLYRVMGHSISMDEVRAYDLQLQSRLGSSLDDAAELVATADSEEGAGEKTSTADSESGRPHETESEKENEKDETRVITFAELQALINSGREDLIPNNKLIPDALNVSFPLVCAVVLPIDGRLCRMHRPVSPQRL